MNNKQLREVAPGLSRGIRLPGEVENSILDLDVVGLEEGIEERFKEQVCSACILIPILRTYVYKAIAVPLDDEIVSTQQENEIDVLLPVRSKHCHDFFYLMSIIRKNISS